MLTKVTKVVFGDANERALKDYRMLVEEINALEAEMQALSDEALAAKTGEFKARLQDGETLDHLLVEAFAVVREASRRVTGLRHYDVQLIGGMVLHHGRIAEMRTGEGKTLVATLPLYLNSLNGRGAHLVTPNDYLSKVGLQQMGPIYHFLGVSAAVIQNKGATGEDSSFMYDPEYHSDDDRYERLRPVSRREAYAADITYGTNNEFGFDYLRDNMVRRIEEAVQHGHAFAIVDEVDNILIDEARTPLIISGTASKPSDQYGYFAKLVKQLKPSSQDSIDAKEPDGDYVFEVKERNVYLTDQGVEKIENLMRRDGVLKGDDELYSEANGDVVPYLDNSLRAQVAYLKDQQYVVMDGQIVIVDEFTGRLMHGRRFSEGLHQAIEAKEGVQVRDENVTMATITFQNFFRMYDKLAGMTGTAKTESTEFEKIYDMEVIVIPTNLPIQRDDHQDQIFMNERGKFQAIVADVKERHERGQPVLIGTVTIETSERLSKALSKAGIPHEILNAKQHFREANIIAQAGRSGAITIATNMAGRGVDILLGGNPEGLARDILRKQEIEVMQATREQWQAALAEAQKRCAEDRKKVLEQGGLYVLGTERHEARRIDNQLRGRAGRQGDPGESRFYLSLEDDLMRRFGGDRVKNFMKMAEIPEDQPIQHNIISKSIEQAQVRVEGHNFDIRKRVLEYDDVVNKQREDLYAWRREILRAQGDDLREQIQEFIAEEIHGLCEQHLAGEPDAWDLGELYRAAVVFRLPEDISAEKWERMTREEIETDILKGALRAYEKQVESFDGSDNMGQIEKELYLRAMDDLWIRHLTDLSVLREGIGLEGIRGRNPLIEYQIQGFQMYHALRDEIKSRIARDVYRVERVRQQATQVQNVRAQHPALAEGATPLANNGGAAELQPVRATAKDQLGRNDPCHCGSGKKYKHCHYREDLLARSRVNPSEVPKTVKRRR